MKVVPWVVVIAVGSVSFFSLWQLSHDSQVRQIADAEHQRDSSNAANDSLRKVIAVRAQLDSARADSIAMLLRLARRTIPHPATDSAAIVADTLAAVARRQYADSVAVAAALDAKDTVIAMERRDHRADMDSSVVRLEGVNRLWEARMVSKDSTVAALTTALDQAVRERDRWRRLAKPPLFKRLLRDLPKLVIAGGVGWLLKG